MLVSQSSVQIITIISLNTPMQKSLPRNPHSLLLGMPFIWTPTRKTYCHQLASFIQDGSKSILFVFGPSGCGKTEMIKQALQLSDIPYQRVSQRHPNQQQEDCQTVDLIDAITKRLLSNLTTNSVYLFYDFPMASIQQQKYTGFRKNLASMLQYRCNSNKHIFILNSEIYNAYHVLGEANSNKIAEYQCVQVIKMQGYLKREMKDIVRKNTNISEREIDEIVELAEGDARKAAHLIYLKELSPIMEKQKQIIKNQREDKLRQFRQKLIENEPKFNGNSTVKPKKQESSISISECSSTGSVRSFSMLKLTPIFKQTNVNSVPLDLNESKLTMFHWMGRFLYGKRLNIDFDPNKKPGPKNPPSRYYTEKQIARYDPKFYFSPLQAYQSTKLAQSTFISLLHQNYLQRFGSIKDIAQMADIFRTVDWMFRGPERWNDFQQITEIQVQMIGWGMLMSNRNSVKDGKMYKIVGGREKAVEKLKQSKIQAISTYFTQNGQYYHRKTDIIKFAHMLRKPHQLSSSPLLSLMFSSAPSFSSSRPQVNSMPSNEQQEDVSLAQGCIKIHSITEQILKERRKKEILRKILQQDSDGSDIEMQNS